MEEYKEVVKKVKILRGSGIEGIIKQLDEFEKTHDVIETKQYCDTMMFVFYWEVQE